MRCAASLTCTERSCRLASTRIGPLIASGDPRVDNPGPDRWFNTGVFSRLPAYTRRANPVTYSGLTGPGYFNLDISLMKSFRVNERFSGELRLENIRVAGSARNHSFGSLTLNNIDLTQASLKISMRN